MASPPEEHPAWSFSAADLALWHPASRTAIIADPHLFYESVRGRRGVAIGGDPLGDPARRLEALRERLAPARLVILGDVIDGPLLNTERDTLRGLLERFPWHWIVTMGNHDRSLIRSASALPEFELVDRLELDGWTLAHGDLPIPLPAIIGHEHPVASLTDEVGVGTSIPALLVWSDLIVVPAFSRWAGGVDARSIMRGKGRSPVLRGDHRTLSPSLYLAAGEEATGSPRSMPFAGSRSPGQRMNTVHFM